MVVPFRRETDELFTAPSNHHKLQADESLDHRVACAEVIDKAVETFGLNSVIRAVRLVAAVNGRKL